MKQENLSNLFSAHRLKNSTLDFLENIKFLKYQVDTLEKFELASYVNSSPTVLKKIFDSYYEVGFCDTFKIKTADYHSEQYKHFEQINKKRKSTRVFSEKPMSYEDLSDFLNLFYTITGKETLNLNSEQVIRKTRNIASGGSLYPTEIYIINNNISDIPQGVYRYNVYHAELEQIKNFESVSDRNLLNDTIANSKGNKTSIDYKNTSFFIIFTSIINKHSFKYQDLGVLFSLIEIGEFVHSAYLAASTLNVGCCADGGFLTNKMSALLELKGSLHIPFISMAVGNKVE